MEEIALIPQINIRLAEKTDAYNLLEIYSYYIKNTAISLEYEVPTVEEFGERIVKLVKNIHFL